VINKIDLPGADVENVKNQLVSSLELEPDDACCVIIYGRVINYTSY
jgi:translation elongation factor EF-4